eukprot:9056169-Prorocentrum_lima.AAC.1
MQLFFRLSSVLVVLHCSGGEHPCVSIHCWIIRMDSARGSYTGMCKPAHTHQANDVLGALVALP